MATGLYSWSQTAATNATADSTINWAEGQSSASVNDSARAMMAVLSKWRDDLSGVQPANTVQTSGGSANVQTLTTNGSIAALTNGWTLTFKAGFTNTAACTMNVDTLGAKNINRVSGTAITSGELIAGCVYTITYHQPADVWILHSASGAGSFASGTAIVFYQASAPTGWTKSTANNDKALRVVSGGTGGSSGGTTAFSTVFASRTIAQANLPNVTLSAASLTGSVSTTINQTNGTSLVTNLLDSSDLNQASNYTTTAGANALRSVSIAAGHLATVSLANGTVTFGGNVPLGGSGTAMDFAVQYADVIVATKD
jgi:hypothetical protein